MRAWSMRRSMRERKTQVRTRDERPVIQKYDVEREAR